MLTKVISELENSILELALVDAFSDMCFYEGEELTAELESYLKDVEEGTNTEEQDNVFFELSMPYIEHSIMIYGKEIYEGINEMTTGADKNIVKAKALVGADGTSQLHDKNRNNLLKMVNKQKPLTEAEEIQIWEGISKTIFPAAKAGIEKAKVGLIKTGKTLANTVKSGILSSKLFAKNLKGFKIPKEDTAASDKK